MEDYKKKIDEFEERIKALDSKVKESKMAVNVVMSKYGVKTGNCIYPLCGQNIVD